MVPGADSQFHTVNNQIEQDYHASTSTQKTQDSTPPPHPRQADLQCRFRSGRGIAAAACQYSLGNAGQPAPNDYTDPTDMTGKSNTEIRAAAEVAAKANPFSIGGVDLGASGIGMGVSSLLSGAIGGPVGLLLGALGSWGAKKVYSEELRNQQQENFFKIIGQIDITDPAGKTGTGIAPIVDAATSTGAKADPTDTWITNYMNGITSGAANPNNFPNAVGGGDPVTDPGSIGSGTGTYSNVA